MSGSYFFLKSDGWLFMCGLFKKKKKKQPFQNAVNKQMLISVSKRIKLNFVFTQY